MTGLECSNCQLAHDPAVPQNLCTKCGKPLFARYDLARAAKTLTRESLKLRQKSLWRYREVLPVRQDTDIVTLGEGWTPMLHAPRLGKRHGMERLYIKDE